MPLKDISENVSMVLHVVFYSDFRSYVTSIMNDSTPVCAAQQIARNNINSNNNITLEIH